MWKKIALLMGFFAVLSIIATGVLAVEIKAMREDIQDDLASLNDQVDTLSKQTERQNETVSALMEENAEMAKEIERLTIETEAVSSRFHHSRSVREITGHFNGTEMALNEVTRLWEECLEERMGLMGVFYAADMVDWWESDYWTELSEDGRKADLLDTGRIHGCWK